MKRPDLSHAALVARVEVRRSVRAVRSSTTRAAAFGIALLFWVALPTVGGGVVAYELGRRLPEVPTAVPVLDFVRGGSAVSWVGLGALAAARAAGRKGDLDAPEGILTTVPARDAALGLLLAEYARMVLVAAIPVLTVAVALAVGAGVVAPLVAVPATAALVLAVSLSLGFPVGIAVKWLTLRSPWLARHRTALLVGVFGLYFLAVTSRAFNEAVTALQRALRDTPLAWFGDAALLGLPGIAAVPVHALVAASLTAVVVPAFGAVGIRSATALWYADRTRAETDEESSSDRRVSLGERALAPLSGVLARPTRTVTLAVWRRTERSPIRLLYVAYPLFFLYAPLRTAFESGVPTSLPVLVALYGTWAVGATVLNPLGDEGAVLPATLLSGIEGRQFVAGHVLSATLVGVPVVALATGAAGALSPLESARWLALTAASAVLVVAGTVLAVAVGTLFPRFGTVEVFRSREVTMPSKGAFAAYSLVLMGGTIGAVVALVPQIAGFVGTLVGLSQVVVRVAGGGLAVLVGVVGPAVAYRWAADRFEGYVLD